MTSSLPKVELHCHLEGTLTPDFVRRLALKNNMTIPDGLFDETGKYAWTDFWGFLRAYDAASAFIRTPEDYLDLIFEYLSSCHDEGAIYVEIFTSVDHASRVGITYGDLIAALAAGIDRAEAQHGIIGRMIVTCVRHLGPEQALKDTKTAVQHLHPYMVGFGMGGDEAQHTCRDFAPAFQVMAGAGLPCTAHAGEVCGPESVIDALDNLPVTRIGHGVRSVEDAALLDRLRDDNIVLEVCPGSNLALGLYADAGSHPLHQLRDAGIKIAFGSDDPPFFRTSIGQEYERAQREFGLTDDDLMSITRAGIDAAFVDDETKKKLRALL